jgi:hypothetical protein
VTLETDDAVSLSKTLRGSRPYAWTVSPNGIVERADIQKHILITPALIQDNIRLNLII